MPKADSDSSLVVVCSQLGMNLCPQREVDSLTGTHPSTPYKCARPLTMVELAVTAPRCNQMTNGVEQFPGAIALPFRLAADPTPFKSLQRSDLGDAAFRPMIFTVTVEDGNFAAKPCSEESEHPNGLRRGLDKFPYPLQDELKVPGDPCNSSLNYNDMDAFAVRPSFYDKQRGTRTAESRGFQSESRSIFPSLRTWISGN